MFNVRLREYTATAVRGKVLPTSSLSVSIQESDVAGVTFSVSERVSTRLQVPFVVGVEYSTGGAYVQPRNGLFIVTEEGGDSADVSKTFTFTGQALVPWLLAGMHQRSIRTYLGSRPMVGKQSWPNATPGRILRSLIDHGKTVDGWAPALTVDFTPTADSAGAAWTNAERWTPEFQDLTSIRAIFDAHVTNGLIDWWAEGTTLRIFRPGSGVVYPNLRLGGPGFTRMPVKQAFQAQFTYLTVIDGAGKYHYFSNPGANTSLGVYHQTMTMSGVKGAADVTRLVQPILTEGRTLRRELSYDWVPAGKLPAPWADFEVGDAVQVRGRNGWIEQRVLGVTVTKTGTDMTVRATVGSKLLNRMKRVISKVEGGSLGEIQGGTGVTVPSVPVLPTVGPKTPTGLHIESNTAVWGADGSALTNVVLAWSEVTQATDESFVDGVSYEVWGRTASAESARMSTTDALTFSIDGWEPGVARFVKMRGVDRLGNLSEFSTEISVTPVAPTSIVPKAPVGLAETYNVADFRPDGTSVATVAVTWTPVTQSVDNALVDIAEYEVTFGPETQRVTASAATFNVPSGKLVSVRVRALTTLGVWGDPSAGLNVTGAVPAALLAAPTAPVLTTGQGIVFAAWNGNLVSGTPPVGFQHVVAELALVSTGPWTRVGTPIPKGGGGVNIRGVAGETVWVRFTPIDTLGRPGAVSASASIVVKAVEVGDIDQAITDAIEEATSKSNNAWDAASVAVTGTVTQYAVTSSETTPPVGGWSVSTPVRTPGTFIWMRSILTYGDGSSTVTNPVLLTGNAGAAGADGTGIEISGSVATYSALPTGLGPTDAGKGYLVEADGLLYIWSGTAFPTNGNGVAFKGDKGDQGLPGPAGTDGAPTYTWLKYADTPTTGMSNDPTGKTYMGLATNKLTATESSVYADYSWSLIRGEAGEDAYTVLLTNESHTFPGSLNAAIAGTTTSRVMAYRGADPIAATIGAISGQQTGLSAVISANGTTDALVTVTVTTALTARSGTLTFPITVDGKLFTKTLTWAVARTGATGSTGAPGSDGADGADAPVVTLVATTQVLTTPATGGTTTPATATVTGSALNTTITVWQYSVDGAAFTATVPAGVARTGNVVTVTGNTMTARTIAVRMADAAGIADTITVAKVADGAQGLQGNQGIPGDPGADGVTTYTWVKYGTSAAGAGMSDDPAGKTYIGLAYNKTTQTESTVASDYQWALIKGDQGPQGVPGTPGADGSPRYTWIKYATTPTTGMSDLPAGKVYMGIAYNKLTATESSVYDDYEWSLIKGEQGIPGAPGTDGTERFTWIKYGTSAAGSGMSDSPTGKTYIGIAYNKTTATESSTPSDYEWSLIQGPQGSDGVSVTSVIVYYQTLPKGSAAPAAPTTTAPPAPWATTEPAYSANVELWAVTRVGYSDGAFSYTAVSKVSAYTAATEAGKRADDAQLTADGKNRIFTSATEPVPSKVNLFANPSFEAGAGTVEVRRNLSTNPLTGASIAGWGSTATLSAAAGGGLQIDGPNGATTSANIAYQALNIPTAPGNWRSGSVDVTVPTGFPAVQLYLYMHEYGTATGLSPTTGVTVTINPGETKTLSAIPAVVAPTGATGVRTLLRAGSTLPAGYRVVVRNSLVEATPTPGAPFGGSGPSPDPDLIPSWAGPANASESVLSGVAVASMSNHANVTLAPYQVSVTGGKAARHTLLSTVAIAVSAGTASTVSGRIYTMLFRARASRPTQVRTRINGVSDADYTLTPEWKDLRATVTGGTPSPLSTGLYVHPDATRPSGTTIDLDDAVLVEGTYTGPFFTTFTNGDLWYVLDPANPSRVTGVKMWNGTAWGDYQIVADSVLVPGSVGGTVIKDGAVTSSKVNAAELWANAAWIDVATVNVLRAGVIETSMLAPGVGDSIDLSANGSVNILVGTVNDLQGSVTDQQAALDQQAAEIAASQAAADAAAAGASSAGIAAAAAQAAAAAAQAGVDKYGTVFTFESDGFGISAPESPMSLKLTNSNISIRRDGVARTTWDENQMIVPKLQSAQVVVGKTVITEKPDGMTWQRL